jgi:tellurite resistance protein TehA-like permease
LDILLFALFTVTYAARWILFFDEARQIVRHQVLSMFLGAIPMGLATIINGLLIFGGGETAVWMAHGLWWLDVTMSVACGLLVPFLMFTLQDHSMEKMTAVWLLMSEDICQAIPPLRRRIWKARAQARRQSSFRGP